MTIGPYADQQLTNNLSHRHTPSHPSDTYHHPAYPTHPGVITMNTLRSTLGTLGRRLQKRSSYSVSRRKRKKAATTSAAAMSGGVVEEEDRQVHCMVVGDSGVGKSSLLVRYTADYFVFNAKEMPAGPVFDSDTGHPVPVEVAGVNYNLVLFDTFSQAERETTRVACYPGTDVCLICFSVVNPASFENVETKWLPEVRRHLPKTPIILVGTQIDLREDLSVTQHLHKSREFPVDPEEGAKMAKRIKAKCYLECSALTMNGIDQVFDRAILKVLRKRKKAKYTAAMKVSSFFGRLRKTSMPKMKSSHRKRNVVT